MGVKKIPLIEKVERLERQEILKALVRMGGVKARAASALGITERILDYKMKKYGIRIKKEVNCK
ncbi:MAG: hypothetical protein M0Z48_03040 [Nitrospiraceae bacterium]|nr:hypothetical protein [Nitrospiraceae bacterium]